MKTMQCWSVLTRSVSGVDGKILGGCATVAGWGYRYDQYTMEESESSCKTDHSNQSPDKIQYDAVNAIYCSLKFGLLGTVRCRLCYLQVL